MILWRQYSIEWLESKRTLLYLTRSCVREAADSVEAIQHKVAGDQGDSLYLTRSCVREAGDSVEAIQHRVAGEQKDTVISDQELCKGGS